jgi:hypothetical protein
VRRYKWSPDGGRRGGAWVEAPAITPGAVGVAMRRAVFGEGAERMVGKFREFGSGGVFMGPKMVAKESRWPRRNPASNVGFELHASKNVRAKWSAQEVKVKP